MFLTTTTTATTIQTPERGSQGEGDDETVRGTEGVSAEWFHPRPTARSRLPRPLSS
jgi:hypothetical protein